MMSSASSHFIIVFILRILKIKPDIIAHLFKKKIVSFIHVHKRLGNFNVLIYL